MTFVLVMSTQGQGSGGASTRGFGTCCPQKVISEEPGPWMAR